MLDVISMRSYTSTMKDYDHLFAAENESLQAVQKCFGDSRDTPPRLQSVLDAWSDLPPHVQETISLLAELKSQQRSNAIGSVVQGKRRPNCPQQMHSGRREILRALRHVPEKYGLVMDDEGWVTVDGIIKLVECHFENLSDMKISDLLVPLGDRIEVIGDRIRATYGHSTQNFRPVEFAIPEIPLYHGTRCSNWSMIELFGLQPMSRRFVQLTSDYDYAHEIASSSGRAPLVLQVQTIAALEDDVRFFNTGTHVWLATHVPSVCLQLWGEPTTADMLGLFDKDSSDE